MQVAGMTAAAVTTSFLLVAGIYSQTDHAKGDQNANLVWEYNLDVPPPVPVFNDRDNEDCKNLIESYYARAL